MQKFLLNKRAFTVALSVALALLTAVIAVAAAFVREDGGMVVPPGPDTSVSEPLPNLPLDSIPGDNMNVVTPPEETPVAPPADTTPVIFNKPEEMRAVYLIAGVDYLADGALTESKVKGDIDKALQSAVDLTMNTVIMDLTYKDVALYQSFLVPRIALSFDVVEYIVSKAREHNLYIYAIYDTRFAPNGEKTKLVDTNVIDPALIDYNSQNVKELADTYAFDGILFDNCYYEAGDSSYANYLQQAPGSDMNRYLGDTTYAMFKAISTTMRETARNMQVGLLTTAVWANDYEDEEGTKTRAAFSALADGHADTRRFVTDGLCDFVAVNTTTTTTDTNTPFETVVQWWADVAQAQELPMYVVMAADKVGSESGGWNAPDQLTKQAMVVKETTGCSGGIYNSLKALSNNPLKSTDALMKFFDNKIVSSHILTELKISQPAQKSFSTYEPMVTFMGASDPTFDVTLNGNKIDTDENGFFTLMLELKAGANTFIFEHKGKTETFTVTRQVQVLKEIAPTGSISVEGGMQISISAFAYEAAKVYATIGGTTVAMKVDETVSDDTDSASGYKKFVGSYTVPAASSSAKSLGNIVIYGEWQGVTENKTGASVTINAKVKVGDGKLVQITSSYAETFPGSPINDVSNPNYFPLAKGTLDYTASNEISYKDGNSTFYYYLLQSGVRVYTKDVTAASGELENNTIKGMTVTSDGRYTTVRFNTEQRVPYLAKYDGSSFSIDFQYTGAVPGSMKLDKNPLFSAANWSGSKLTLKLRTSGGFYGYTAYYDSDGALVFRFNSPPASLSSAVIVIDPGHGGNDPGALGNIYNESEINAQIASKVASILRNSGADVTNTGGGLSLQGRVDTARAQNPHIFVSIHGNTAASTSARGVEAYYFRSYGQRLASSASSATASSYGTTNRGGKYGLYYVTRVAEYQAILLETGFLSNTTEYGNLIESSVQQKIAQGICNGIASAISASGAQYAGLTGTQSSGDVKSVPVTGITLDKTTLTLKVGEKATLKPTVAPEEATNKTVTWKTSDAKIAEVSALGEVTAKAAGTATITATTQDGEKTATCTVTVTGAEVKVTSVALNQTSLGLKVGGTAQLTATVQPDNATNRAVNWSSSNTRIVTVDGSGNLKAVAVGTATVTATAQDGSGKSASCTVTVSNANVPVGGIQIPDVPGGQLTIGACASGKIQITITPDNATNKAVRWESSDARIVTVDDGGHFTGMNVGEAILTVISQDVESIKKTIKIIVTAKPS